MMGKGGGIVWVAGAISGIIRRKGGGAFEEDKINIKLIKKNT